MARLVEAASRLASMAAKVASLRDGAMASTAAVSDAGAWCVGLCPRRLLDRFVVSRRGDRCQNVEQHRLCHAAQQAAVGSGPGPPLAPSLAKVTT